MAYNDNQATQADVDIYRDQIRAEFAGQPFQIDSNGAGLRVECTVCHSSNSDSPVRFLRNHRDSDEDLEKAGFLNVKFLSARRWKKDRENDEQDEADFIQRLRTNPEWYTT